MITVAVLAAELKKAGTHNSAKTHAGENPCPALSGRGKVTQGKPGVVA